MGLWLCDEADSMIAVAGTVAVAGAGNAII